MRPISRRHADLAAIAFARDAYAQAQRAAEAARYTLNERGADQAVVRAHAALAAALSRVEGLAKAIAESGAVHQAVGVCQSAMGPCARAHTMIIRRARRERGFAIIDNAVMNDERLTDHLGLLVYLLSRPPDWEVRQAQLMKRFAIGRDKLQRMLRDLRGFGYMRNEKLRDPRHRRVARHACDGL